MNPAPRAYIGVTDLDWYRTLRAIPDLSEANFWKPNPGHAPRMAMGELFLFKLHSPHNAIVGGGWFGHYSQLPVSLAWNAFERSNGANSFEQMRARIMKYRRLQDDSGEDFQIGCLLLEEPFFLDEEAWIAQPSDWKPNIVSGKYLDLSSGEGLRIWADLQDRLQRRATEPTNSTSEPDAPRYGSPILSKPRLGQGSFRIMLTDAYERRCSISSERTLPVLEAAHIRPYGQGGEHRLDNGLLLRSDLHILFDRGYLTVTPEHRVEVSPRIKEEFENGRDYYALHGREIRQPIDPANNPSEPMLIWHNDNVFNG